jgi:hypothetical protein
MRSEGHKKESGKFPGKEKLLEKERKVCRTI